MSEDLTGKRLGHYSIDGVLGKGGMSVMYRATDVRLGRKVALKVIAGHLTADAEFRERFVDEARNTSAIDHANVVPLYDFGEVDGLLYIAMRMVDGSDLAKLIKEGPLAPNRAIGLLSQVGAALDMLHERGLVHLDIKPANVLVTAKESAEEHIYLADFGLTRRGATGHRTRTGDFLGSPMYAAPEHLRGEPVDGRTDLYALACVLYACLTGRAPFRGQVPDVISGHLGPNIPSVTGVVELPSEVDAVLAKGMAKRAEDRYDNCRELVTAAKQALSSLTDADTPPKVRKAGSGASAAPPKVAALPGEQPEQSVETQAAETQPGSGEEAETQPAESPTSPGRQPVAQPQVAQPQAVPGYQPQQPTAQQQAAQQQPAVQQPGPPQQPPQQPQQPPQQPPGQVGQPMQPGPAGQSAQPQQPGPAGQSGQVQSFGPPTPQPMPGNQPQYEPVRLRDPMPAGTGAFGPRPGDSMPPPTPPPRKRRWILPVSIGVVLAAVIVVLVIVFTRQDSGGSGGIGDLPKDQNTQTYEAPPTKLPRGG